MLTYRYPRTPEPWNHRTLELNQANQQDRHWNVATRSPLASHSPSCFARFRQLDDFSFAILQPN